MMNTSEVSLNRVRNSFTNAGTEARKAWGRITKAVI